MNKERKTRSDAKVNELESKLTPELRDELRRISLNGSLQDLRNFAESVGVSMSLASASRNALKLRASADRIMKRNEAMDLVRKEAEKAGITLTQAALEQGAIAIGDILDAGSDPTSEEGQKLLLNGLGTLTGIRNTEIAADRVKTARGALALAERKVAMLEAKMAAAREIVEAPKMSAQERDRKLKEIFGIQS
jgi:hypothetical protein